MSKPAPPTPMMQQYFEIKEKHKDSILFYRLGDFYEMFFDDAELASKELELTLTGRDWGQPERAPMCGVPYHSCEGYIARLIKKGYKVAICEQTEDPAKAKGLVRREVIRTITPGTVTDSSMLEENSNNFIAAVCLTETAGAICFCDISTGQMVGCRQSGADFTDRVMRELGKIGPREVIFCDHAWSASELVDFASAKLSALCENEGGRFAPETADERLKKQFDWQELTPEMQERPELVRAAGALLLYLDDTLAVSLSHVRKLEIWESSGYMELDLNARRNLELTVSLTGEKKGTLLSVMDMTRTSMGGRLIKNWLEKPLMNVAAIRRRQDAVRALTEDPALTEELGSALSKVLDMERIITRVACQSAGARDLRGLLQGINELPNIRSLLMKAGGTTLPLIASELDMLEDVAAVIDAAIIPEPPLLLKEGGVIKPGYSEELDNLQDLLRGGAGRLASIEARERERTGLRTLKVGYNRVFGYYIEISRALAAQAPDEYIRKQTLANAERYITPELKDLEGEILSAGERSKALEYELFCQVRDKVSESLDRVQRTATAIASADVLRSFADVAVKYGYTCPDVNELDLIEIKDGRHPVVERVLKDGFFVPNDTYLNRNEHRVYVITGPNMAGKSTYMRQVALITILAQCGSFVPAASATIGITDRIFTRVGASDNLFSGLSTFMVEMTEVADILKNATARSLLILDEVGRGTSTFDGMSIARAVLEYIADKKTLGARTLFATHYHELCSLEGEKQGVKNYNIVVKKKDDRIVFIKKIVPGGVSESYGIDVAKLAGLPDKVIRRAKAVLTESEKARPKKQVVIKEEDQLSMDAMARAEVIEELKRISPETMSPIEAMNTLYSLCRKVQG